MKRGKRAVKGKSKSAVQQENLFLGCPAGHRLPHRTSAGECTPIYCAATAETSGKLKPRAGETKTVKLLKLEKDAARRARTEAADAVIDGIVPKDSSEMTQTAARAAAEIEKSEEIVKIGHAAGRLAARKAYLQYPKEIEDPESFVTRKQVELLPDAMAEIEFQLKMGDDKQRWDAASRVMDMSGFGKKDASGGGAQTVVIINAGGQPVTPPWRTEKVINAQITSGAAPRSEAGDSIKGGSAGD